MRAHWRGDMSLKGMTPSIMSLIRNLLTSIRSDDDRSARMLSSSTATFASYSSRKCRRSLVHF